MDNEKYEILKDNKIEFEGHTLYRIQALKKIITKCICIDKGHLGGYIESNNNLSAYNNCWIDDDAKVFGNACVTHNATIRDDAVVKDNALICDNVIINGNAVICNNSVIRNDAKVTNHAKVCGNSIVENHAVIRGYAIIYHGSLIKNDAIITESSSIRHATISGNAVIRGNMKINNTNNVLVIGPIGSREAYTTFIRQSKTIYVSCGCFFGTIEEFKKAVTNTHKYKDDNYYDTYMNTIEYVKKHFAICKK